MIGSDRDWQIIASAWRHHEMAFDVLGSASQWSAVLDAVDLGELKLSLREQNQLLDTLSLQIDAEREAAARALEARVGREAGIVRGRRR